MLIRNSIKTPEKIRLFMVFNATRLQEEFYPRALLDLDAVNCFKDKYKVFGSSEKYVQYIFDSFRNLDEFLESKEMTLYDYFNTGRPTSSMKHTKAGEMPEEILAHSGTIHSIKMKRDPLIGLYLKDFLKKFKIIEERIDCNQELRKTLDNGF